MNAPEIKKNEISPLRQLGCRADFVKSLITVENCHEKLTLAGLLVDCKHNVTSQQTMYYAQHEKADLLIPAFTRDRALL